MSVRVFLNALFLIVFSSIPALAEGKDGAGYRYYKNLARRQALVMPQLENGKHPHNSQWFGKEWYAEDWLVQYERDLDLIDGFYKADIFHDQKMEGDIPVLVVGPNFYHLSGYDKRRVTHVLDVVYAITDGDGAQVFKLQDWRTGEDIGWYSKNGLQIQ